MWSYYYDNPKGGTRIVQNYEPSIDDDGSEIKDVTKEAEENIENDKSDSKILTLFQNDCQNNCIINNRSNNDFGTGSNMITSINSRIKQSITSNKTFSFSSQSSYSESTSTTRIRGSNSFQTCVTRASTSSSQWHSIPNKVYSIQPIQSAKHCPPTIINQKQQTSCFQYNNQYNDDNTKFVFNKYTVRSWIDPNSNSNSNNNNKNIFKKPFPNIHSFHSSIFSSPHQIITPDMLNISSYNFHTLTPKISTMENNFLHSDITQGTRTESIIQSNITYFHNIKKGFRFSTKLMGIVQSKLDKYQYLAFMEMIEKMGTMLHEIKPNNTMNKNEKVKLKTLIKNQVKYLPHNDKKDKEEEKQEEEEEEEIPKNLYQQQPYNIYIEEIDPDTIPKIYNTQSNRNKVSCYFPIDMENGFCFSVQLISDNINKNHNNNNNNNNNDNSISFNKQNSYFFASSFKNQPSRYRRANRRPIIIFDGEKEFDEENNNKSKEKQKQLEFSSYSSKNNNNDDATNSIINRNDKNSLTITDNWLKYNQEKNKNEEEKVKEEEDDDHDLEFYFKEDKNNNTNNNNNNNKDEEDMDDWLDTCSSQEKVSIISTSSSSNSNSTSSLFSLNSFSSFLNLRKKKKD